MENVAENSSAIIANRTISLLICRLFKNKKFKGRD